MICPNCKRPVEKGVRFCTSCGADLRNTGRKPKKKKSSLFMITVSICSVCLVVILVCGGILLYQNTEAYKLNKQLDLGNRYLAEGNYEEAELHFNRALEYDEESSEAELGLAEVYTQQKQPEKAEKAVDRASRRSSDMTGEQLYRLNTYRRRQSKPVITPKPSQEKAYNREQNRSSEVAPDSTRMASNNGIDEVGTPDGDNKIDEAMDETERDKSRENDSEEVSGDSDPTDDSSILDVINGEETEDEEELKRAEEQNPDGTDEDDQDEDDLAEEEDLTEDGTDDQEKPDTDNDAGEDEPWPEDGGWPDDEEFWDETPDPAEEQEESGDLPETGDSEDNTEEEPEEDDPWEDDGSLWEDPEDGEEDSPEESAPQEEEDEFGWDTEYYSTEDPTGEETWDDSDRVEEPLEPEAEVLPEGGSGWEEEFSEETDGTEGGEESTPGLSAEEILESTMSSFMLTRDFAPQSVSSLEGTLYTTMEDIDYDGQTELVVISMHSGRMSFTVYESDGTQADVSCEESADSCAFGDDLPESYKGTQTAFRKGNCIGVATYQLGTTQDGGSSGIFAAVMMWSIDASGSASRVLNAAWNAGMDPQDFMNQLAGQGLSGDWILSGAGLDLVNQPDLIYSAEDPLENGFHNVESASDYDYVTVNASGSTDYADVRVN